jgi:hypothetical protein
MISKCANPTCSTPFHYLRDGKVFRVDLNDDNENLNSPYLVDGKKAPRRTEHFWLCGPCAQTLSLIFNKQTGVHVVQKPLARRAAAS